MVEDRIRKEALSTHHFFNPYTLSPSSVYARRPWKRKKKKKSGAGGCMALGRGGRRKGGLGQREALRHARVGLLARIGLVGRLRAQGGYLQGLEKG